MNDDLFGDAPSKEISLDKAARAVAREQKKFNADDVWAKLAQLGAHWPHEPKRMGNALKRLEKRGLIRQERVELTHVHSRRSKCHSRPVQIWISLIYGQAP